MTPDPVAGAVTRPMRADARRNYARLLDAARDAFTEHGTEARMDDVARRAGVGPGTLYRHFPTREALLAAMYREDVDLLAAEATRLAETLPPRAALDEWMRLNLDYHRRKRGLGAVVKAMLATDTETLAYCRTTLREAAERVLRRAQETGEVRADVDPMHVMRLLHGVVLATESVPEDTDRLLSIVLAGLRPD